MATVGNFEVISVKLNVVRMCTRAIMQWIEGKIT